MANNTFISALDEQFKNDCEVINLRYEYPGYTGTEQWAIVTDLSEKELAERYAEQITPYKPFIVLSASFGNVRDDYRRNEKKHEMRALRHGHAFDVSDGIEEHHPEIATGSLEDDYIYLNEVEELRKAIGLLKPIQRERLIKYFFEGKSSRTIAREEGVNYSKVDKSIAAAIKNLKKFLL